ncbi:MAG: glutathione S-transferase family protein [Gammaproteobacteria bacterium]|nr:glutathione S-transferase family protein [Gammaproteobacteria bacterium]
MLALYQQHDSGNCYKVRLILAHMDVPFRIVEINALDGSTRAPEFLALNPGGKVPLAVFDDGRRLAESNALLLYFARGGKFLPDDPWTQAQIHSWLFFEQYAHEPAVAVRRSLLFYPERRGLASERRLAQLLQQGNAALAVMEQRLAQADWLVAGAATVADLSLYAYTHLAADGGFDLQRFPAISAWLPRVAALPGHVDINWRPPGN